MTLVLSVVTHAMAAHSATSDGKHRSPWAVAGLNLITLGFYSVYWWYAINRELRNLGRQYDAPELEKEPALSALAFATGGCLVIPLVWTAVTTARRIQLAQDLVGTTRFLPVWVPVALLAAYLLVHFAGGGSIAALVAIGAGALAFKVAAIAYMQVSLNEIWALNAPTVESPCVADGFQPHSMPQV